MPETSKQWNCSKSILLWSSRYLMHSSVDSHDIFILNKRFSKTYTLCKLVYFLPCLTNHIMYRLLSTTVLFFWSSFTRNVRDLTCSGLKIFFCLWKMDKNTQYRIVCELVKLGNYIFSMNTAVNKSSVCGEGLGNQKNYLYNNCCWISHSLDRTYSQTKWDMQEGTSDWILYHNNLEVLQEPLVPADYDGFDLHTVTGIFVTECAKMPFQKFFLWRTQVGTAFWNLFFLTLI